MTHSHTAKYKFTFKSSRPVFQRAENGPENHHSTPKGILGNAIAAGHEAKAKVMAAYPEHLPPQDIAIKTQQEFEKGSPMSHKSLTMETSRSKNDVQIYDKDGKLIGAKATVKLPDGLKGPKGLSILHTVPPPKWEFQLNGKTAATVEKDGKYAVETLEAKGAVKWLRLRVKVTASAAFLEAIKDTPMRKTFAGLTPDKTSNNFVMERRNTENGKSLTQGVENSSPYFANYVLSHDPHDTAQKESGNDAESLEQSSQLHKQLHEILYTAELEIHSNDTNYVAGKFAVAIAKWFHSLDKDQQAIVVSHRKSGLPYTWVGLERGKDMWRLDFNPLGSTIPFDLKLKGKKQGDTMLGTIVKNATTIPYLLKHLGKK